MCMWALSKEEKHEKLQVWIRDDRSLCVTGKLEGAERKTQNNEELYPSWHCGGIALDNILKVMIIITVEKKKFILSISCFSTTTLMDLAKAARPFSVLGCFNISFREARSQFLKYEKFHAANYCELWKTCKNKAISRSRTFGPQANRNSETCPSFPSLPNSPSLIGSVSQFGGFRLNLEYRANSTSRYICCCLGLLSFTPNSPAHSMMKLNKVFSESAEPWDHKMDKVTGQSPGKNNKKRLS